MSTTESGQTLRLFCVPLPNGSVSGAGSGIYDYLGRMQFFGFKEVTITQDIYGRFFARVVRVKAKDISADRKSGTFEVGPDGNVVTYEELYMLRTLAADGFRVESVETEHHPEDIKHMTWCRPCWNDAAYEAGVHPETLAPGPAGDNSWW